MVFIIQILLIGSLLLVMTAPTDKTKKDTKRPNRKVSAGIAVVVSLGCFIYIFIQHGFKTDMMTLVTLFVLVMSGNVFLREKRKS